MRFLHGIPRPAPHARTSVHTLGDAHLPTSDNLGEHALHDLPRSASHFCRSVQKQRRVEASWWAFSARPPTICVAFLSKTRGKELGASVRDDELVVHEIVYFLEKMQRKPCTLNGNAAPDYALLIVIATAPWNPLGKHNENPRKTPLPAVTNN